MKLSIYLHSDHTSYHQGKFLQSAHLAGTTHHPAHNSGFAVRIADTNDITAHLLWYTLDTLRKRCLEYRSVLISGGLSILNWVPTISIKGGLIH